MKTKTKKTKKKTPTKRTTKTERRLLASEKNMPSYSYTTNGFGGEIGVGACFDRRARKHGIRVAILDAYDGFGDSDGNERVVTMSFTDPTSLYELADQLNVVAKWMEEDKDNLT